jgi:hypothetical protein
MTTTPPDDVAAMFDLPPLPAASQSTTQAADALEAAEAALAAELACTIESGGVADDAPDSRTYLRVKVSWPARMRLPNGRVIELEVRNISESGVGLTSDEDIPAYTVVGFEMGVPQPDEAGNITPVKGTIKTTYTVAHGSQILCGGTWQTPPAGQELVDMWIKRLRR